MPFQVQCCIFVWKFSVNLNSSILIAYPVFFVSRISLQILPSWSWWGTMVNLILTETGWDPGQLNPSCSTSSRGPTFLSRLQTPPWQSPCPYHRQRLVTNWVDIRLKQELDKSLLEMNKGKPSSSHISYCVQWNKGSWYFLTNSHHFLPSSWLFPDHPDHFW